ncbi:hypothetical protein BHM03_00002868 [Ensete ventricosum]|uniref:E2F/DP family winged-helix DNA-binding domain-containing protein n=1 Tax=Ensete ventricosum TaxID=4639 RepID=A0A445M9U7_ENSVE|nr:hypothetical protein BHM03_00002868 [Ensete ventricosum]
MHANHSVNIPSGATDRTMIPKCECVPNLINSSMQEDEIYEAPDSPSVGICVYNVAGVLFVPFLNCLFLVGQVADEIIYELSSLEKKDLQFVFDEKNIRRRVYDAFNVLMAINVIAKDKKEVKWVGFPSTETEELTQIKEEKMKLLSKIEQKVNYLKELEEKVSSFCGCSCPLCGAKSHRCNKYVVLIFRKTPFTLHDADSILRAMRRPTSVERNHDSHNSTKSPDLAADQNCQKLFYPSASS